MPTTGYQVFRVVNGVILTLVVLAVLYPIVNIVARSFSDAAYIDAGKVDLWPRGFNVATYKAVLSNGLFWTDYRNTVVYTVVSTVISLALTTTYAYVLSKKDLRGRTFLVGVAVFTMFFSGGLIPNYVLVNNLGMRDSIWAMVLPNAISVFNLLVMKAFFESMPSELEEAAAIDGLSSYGILLRIVLPLSKAVLATMTLFYAVASWNSWFSAFLYLDKPNLYPVSLYLRNMIAGATNQSSLGMGQDDTQAAANIQAVTIVLTTLPILFVYPFVQRYFVKGVMIGAVKG